MNADEFEDTVVAVIEAFPAWVKAALDNIEILVVDEPDPDLPVGAQDLLGLYQGTPLPERGVNYAGVLPDIITIFRLAHLQLDLPPEELRLEIARTVVHEVAHYFGIDDDHLDQIGWG